MFLDQTFQMALYSPVPLLNYFINNYYTTDLKSDKEFAIYKTTINKTMISMYISKSNFLLNKIRTINIYSIHKFRFSSQKINVHSKPFVY